MPVYYPLMNRNHHLTSAKQYFSDGAGPAFVPAPGMRFVFICYTNRSGSNLVAELIGSDGRYPVAQEDLNRKTFLPFARTAETRSFDEYFRKLVDMRAKNNVFLVKTLPAHLHLLGAYGILDRIMAQSSFMLVERSDKLAQAISLAIALKTGGFTSQHKTGLKPEDLTFSEKEVTHAMKFVALSHSLFTEFFTYNGLVPEHLIYEQVLEDPAHYVGRAAAKCGLPGLQVERGETKLQRQAGGVNREWRDLYVSAMAARRGVGKRVSEEQRDVSASV